MMCRSLIFWLLVGCTSALPELPAQGALGRCGDGQRQAGEACDDGNASDSDGCVGANCSLAACGDGFRRADVGPGEPGYEACDDGNSVDTDGCRNDCAVARCGDGIVRTDLLVGQAGYEACDDGNLNDNDTCSQACQGAYCGDGFRQTGEACDDGNSSDSDACLVNCTLARCGDGSRRSDLTPGSLIECSGSSPCQTLGEICLMGSCVTEGYEACDDGNSIDEDACSSHCFDAYCGDGITRADLNPEDEGYEACDDGNANDHDGCLNRCVAAALNDGVHRRDVPVGSLNPCTNLDDQRCDLGEECRFYPDPCADGETCEGTCQDPQYEACDDGDRDDTDGCTPNGLTMGSIEPLAGRSCQAIATHVPGAEDGVFWMDPDGPTARDEQGEISGGAGDPVRVYCAFEVSEDERWGWTLFLGPQTPEVLCGECAGTFAQPRGRMTCGSWSFYTRNRYNPVSGGVCAERYVRSAGNYVHGFYADVWLVPGFRVKAVRYSGSFRSNVATTMPGFETPQCQDSQPIVHTDIEHVFDRETDSVEWVMHTAGDTGCGRALVDLTEVWVR